MEQVTKIIMIDPIPLFLKVLNELFAYNYLFKLEFVDKQCVKQYVGKPKEHLCCY